MKITIVTTRHWSGDPRLNRHVSYLSAAGHSVELVSVADRGKLRSLIAAAQRLLSTSADAVILPDPDFYAIGALLARIRGLHPVIDIHEDYPTTARNRSWIPNPLRPFVSISARAMIALGRFLAGYVIVAAPQLSQPGDALVLNVPNPAQIKHDRAKDPTLLVYVGDITVARGALDMVRTLSRLPSEYNLTLIGPVSSGTRAELDRTIDELDLPDRVDLRGRLDHGAAWELASRAQYGLSLLQDTPAYRDAVATKLWEYMASGMIPIVSDLPGQRSLVTLVDAELACPDPRAAANLILRLANDPQRVSDLSRRARVMAIEKWAETRPDLAIQSVFDP